MPDNLEEMEKAKATKAEMKKAEEMENDQDEDQDDDEDEDEEDEDMSETFDISSIFEGMDLSEGFKEKASLVFEAAVNEAAVEKSQALVNEAEERLHEEFESALSESIDEITENLDSYLDYVVKEWLSENEVAIESGIKVEMAESFMEGLKELFYSHNVKIDEETIDVVSELEAEVSEARKAANRAITENLELEQELNYLRAQNVFESMTYGLSAQQVERFRTLSEKLDNSDLEVYQEDLNTLKETFFKGKKTSVINEDLNAEDDQLVTEETNNSRVSQYDTVNAYAQALKTIK